MVELQTPQLDAIFHALGDPTRRRMLRALSAGEQTVSQLAEPFAMSLAAASKHIKALETAGLIRREVRGRTHVCHLDPGPLASAHEWLSFYEGFWTLVWIALNNCSSKRTHPNPHHPPNPKEMINDRTCNRREPMAS